MLQGNHDGRVLESKEEEREVQSREGPLYLTFS
jgi:hypothetical protein